MKLLSFEDGRDERILERISQNRSRSRLLEAQALTEERPKTSVILPFLQGRLASMVFNLDEVIPELLLDVGTKEGVKSRLAVKIDG